MILQQGVRYVIDSDVLIQAHRAYYRFDICSGFWQALILHHGNSAVTSIDKVLEEINNGEGTDDLKRWVANEVPRTFFDSTNDVNVINAYGILQNWANTYRISNQAYTQYAKQEFARLADAYLIAYAKANRNHVVVTQEGRHQQTGRVYIPVACDAFNIRCINAFDMLQELGVNLRI